MVRESQKPCEGKYHLELLCSSAGADKDVPGELGIQTPPEWVRFWYCYYIDIEFLYWKHKLVGRVPCKYKPIYDNKVSHIQTNAL